MPLVVHSDMEFLPATGFLPQEEVMQKLLGETVAKKVGQIWGFDVDGGDEQYVEAHGATWPVVCRRRL